MHAECIKGIIIHLAVSSVNIRLHEQYSFQIAHIPFCAEVNKNNYIRMAFTISALSVLSL